MKTEQARILKNVIQAVVVVSLGYFVRHKVVETGDQMWIAAGWLLTGWVVLRLAFALKRGYANFRSHTNTGISVENLDKLTTATMPAWSRGHYLIEKQAYRGAWRTLLGKPLSPAGDFSVAGGPNSAKVAAALLLLVAACAAVAGAYLPGLIAGFWPRLIWFAGAGYLVLYAAIWVIGGRRRLKEGGHRIAGDQLMLDVGMRCSGAVPLDAIASCDLQRLDRTDDSALWTVTPGERTNVLIALKEVTALSIIAFGSPRQISKRRIALYVDRPAAFVEAVSRAMASGRHPIAA